MSKEMFSSCSKIANNNLKNKGKGNLREFLKTYLLLSKNMGKEMIAFEAINELPPEASLNNPAHIDDIISFCAQNLNKENIVEKTR